MDDCFHKEYYVSRSIPAAALDKGTRKFYKIQTLETPDRLLLIAGNGRYPELIIRGARAAGVRHVTVAAFDGETAAPTLAAGDVVELLRVGQLGRLLDIARRSGATHAIMAGQIAPKNLFDLRPDMQALLLLAKIKERNAETLFGAVAASLEKIGVPLLPATRFVEDQLASEGHIAGPKFKAREKDNAEFGFRIARETSRLDIGQTVVVKKGTVLAVEAFEGTNETIERAGRVGRGGGLVVKVSKPGQDMRFDVPVVGETTLEKVAEAGLSGIVAEAGRVLFLDRQHLCAIAEEKRITLYGIKS